MTPAGPDAQLVRFTDGELELAARRVVVRLRGVETANESNVGWGKLAQLEQRKRKRAQIARVDAALRAWLRLRDWQPPAPPFACALVRVWPRRTDRDGVVAAFKTIRDSVPLALGLAKRRGRGDGINDPITFRYAQRKGPPGVEIHLAW